MEGENFVELATTPRSSSGIGRSKSTPKGGLRRAQSFPMKGKSDAPSATVPTRRKSYAQETITPLRRGSPRNSMRQTTPKTADVASRVNGLAGNLYDAENEEGGSKQRLERIHSAPSASFSRPADRSGNGVRSEGSTSPHAALQRKVDSGRRAELLERTTCMLAGQKAMRDKFARRLSHRESKVAKAIEKMATVGVAAGAEADGGGSGGLNPLLHFTQETPCDSAVRVEANTITSRNKPHLPCSNPPPLFDESGGDPGTSPLPLLPSSPPKACSTETTAEVKVGGGMARSQSEVFEVEAKQHHAVAVAGARDALAIAEKEVATARLVLEALLLDKTDTEEKSPVGVYSGGLEVAVTDVMELPGQVPPPVHAAATASKPTARESASDAADAAVAAAITSVQSSPVDVFLENTKRTAAAATTTTTTTEPESTKRQEAQRKCAGTNTTARAEAALPEARAGDGGDEQDVAGEPAESKGRVVESRQSKGSDAQIRYAPPNTAPLLPQRPPPAPPKSADPAAASATVSAATCALVAPASSPVVAVAATALVIASGEKQSQVLHAFADELKQIERDAKEEARKAAAAAAETRKKEQDKKAAAERESSAALGVRVVQVPNRESSVGEGGEKLKIKLAASVKTAAVAVANKPRYVPGTAAPQRPAVFSRRATMPASTTTPVTSPLVSARKRPPPPATPTRASTTSSSASASSPSQRPAATRRASSFTSAAPSPTKEQRAFAKAKKEKAKRDAFCQEQAEQAQAAALRQQADDRAATAEA